MPIDDNLRDYKNTIPQLFWYNAFIILSNGSDSRIGSLTAEWEHFAEWKKINSEGEQGVVSLETMLRGTCEPARLLDLVENFILFEEAKGGLRQAGAKNHQYLGVNNAFAAVREHPRRIEGELGVFWHTQGSGKSYSMVFFAQKVLRKLAGQLDLRRRHRPRRPGRPDLQELCRTGAVTEARSAVRAQAASTSSNCCVKTTATSLR